MKSKAKLLIVILVLYAVNFSSCTKEDELIPLDQFALSVPALELSVGEVQPIIATATPENTTENLSWISSDENIAAIQYNEMGLVAGVKGITLGSATLTATNPNGSISKTVSANVIIKVEKIVLEEVPLSSPSETMYQVVFTPADATIQTVTWTSSDPSVATVIDGLVTAVSPGVTVITATTTQGEKTASVEIAVSGNPPILGLQYCTISGTGSYNSDVVTTTGGDANINYAGVQPGGNYEFYESEKLIVQPGGSFDLSIVQSNNWSMTVVWIDWNRDKDFVDDGERVQIFGAREQLNDGPFNATINVPADAAPGVIRMRILTGDSWTTDPDATPCGEIANSSTKDFVIEIGGTAYCTVSGTGAYNSDAVTTTGGDTNINYSGGQPSGNYEFYTEETLSIQSGGSFDLTVINSNGWSRSIAWIDWNADGDFDDDEEMQVPLSPEELYSGDDAISYTITVNVPAGLPVGVVRMRILTGDAWSYNDALMPASPCGELANSTTKDFNIKVL